MFNVKLGLVLVGVTAAMWGCGDDDKPSGSGGRGGTAGSAGKGGAGGTAGKAGTGGATGGTAGKAGAGGTAGATGGTAGSGGTAGATGGTAGTTGGTAGSAGTAPAGGQGGEGGDALGGAGGEGGAGNLTTAEACAATCEDQMGLACDNACVATCVGLAGDTLAPTEYAALIQCQATELGASDYVCREQPSFPTAPDMAGLVWDGPCETELCAWTCGDGTFVDEDTYGHCGC
jgi:hypothetical protein